MPDILTSPESEDYKNSAEYWKERFISVTKSASEIIRRVGWTDVEDHETLVLATKWMDEFSPDNKRP